MGLRAFVLDATKEMAALLDLPTVHVRNTTTLDRHDSFIRGSKACLARSEHGPIIKCQQGTQRLAIGHEVIHAYHIEHNKSMKDLNDLALSSIGKVQLTSLKPDFTFFKHYARWINTRASAIICNEAVGYSYNAYRRRMHGSSYPARFIFHGDVIETNVKQDAYVTPAEAREIARESGILGLDMLAQQTLTYAYHTGAAYGRQASLNLKQEPYFEVTKGKDTIVKLYYPMRTHSEVRIVLRDRVRQDALSLVKEAVSASQQQFNFISTFVSNYQ